MRASNHMTNGNTKERKVPYSIDMVSQWFMDTFSPFLAHKIGKATVVILYFIYLGVAVYGCTQIREGLEPVNLLVEDSYAAQFYESLQNHFWPYGVPIQIAFNNPGNVADPYTKHQIMKAVMTFANCPHGIGIEGLQFWMLDFDSFLMTNSKLFMDDIDEQQFFAYLSDFFHVYPYRNYGSDVLWAGSNGSIKAITSFRLLLGVKDFSSASEQMDTLNTFRHIANQFNDFNITTYHHMWPFIEQYTQVLPNVFQELYSGILCMIVVALLFIPNPLGAVWVTLCITSIDAGVIGYMTLWGLNIDCITMITLIMSIGFSVDFSAHIAYSYAVNEGAATDDRIRLALGNLGWPIVQGGVSTILGVVVLADVKSYMFVAFCKTVLLIISIGIIHGIVFLPILISVADLKLTLIRYKQKKTKKEQQENTNYLREWKTEISG